MVYFFGKVSYKLIAHMKSFLVFVLAGLKLTYEEYIILNRSECYIRLLSNILCGFYFDGSAFKFIWVGKKQSRIWFLYVNSGRISSNWLMTDDQFLFLVGEGVGRVAFVCRDEKKEIKATYTLFNTFFVHTFHLDRWIWINS